MCCLKSNSSSATLSIIISVVLFAALSGHVSGDTGVETTSEPATPAVPSGGIARQAGVEPPLLTEDDLKNSTHVELSREEIDFMEASLNPMAAEPVSVDHSTLDREPDPMLGAQEATTTGPELTAEEIQFNQDALNPTPAATVHFSEEELLSSPPL